VQPVARIPVPEPLPALCRLLLVSTAGSATVLDGHVQVISCSKKVAYKEGKMQVIPFYDIYDKATAQPIKPSPEQFIAKPYTMDFILRKANDY
jgi:hypothetical protein